MDSLNFFSEERLHFQPTVPVILKKIELLEQVEETFTAPASTIWELFPKSRDSSIVHFRERGAKKDLALRVGVVLSGGQAPGGHNVIIGLFDALKKLHPDSRLFGFLGGPSGIVENRSKELNQHDLSPYRNTGGFDMIGSGRTKIETSEQFDAALETCKDLNLDGLVIIGGDDSNTNAAFLSEYFQKENCKTCVIGVPKTIDGDLKNIYIGTSFGFDTACKIYSEMIGNICRDALSAKKYTHFIKLMGRSASHIALECALQTHPNLTFIGEEIAAKKLTLQQLTEIAVNCVLKRSMQGKNYGVILIPEGLIEFVPEMKTLIQEINSLLGSGVDNVLEQLSAASAATFSFLPKEIGEQLLLERDPHGNVQVSQINTEQLLIHTVKDALKKRSDYKGKFSPIGHFFGYEGRCGYPSNFDANYCYALGFTSAALINNKLTGYMSALSDLDRAPDAWIPTGIPFTLMMDLEERKGKKKAVIKKTLVDLEAEPYQYFSAHKENWMLNDNYRFPGPIQFAGPEKICNETTLTLKLEYYSKQKGQKKEILAPQ